MIINQIQHFIFTIIFNYIKNIHLILYFSNSFKTSNFFQITINYTNLKVIFYRFMKKSINIIIFNFNNPYCYESKFSSSFNFNFSSLEIYKIFLSKKFISGNIFSVLFKILLNKSLAILSLPYKD